MLDIREVIHRLRGGHSDRRIGREIKIDVNNHENDPFGGRLKWTTWRSSKMDHLAVTQNDPPARR